MYVIAPRAQSISAPKVEVWVYDNIVTDTLHLSYKQNYPRFLLDYPPDINPDSVEYRYRIDGYEEDWNAETDGPWVYYTDMPPGNYKFIVQRRLKGGNWSEPTQHIFIIDRPWWRTWPAILLYTIFATCLVVYIPYLIHMRIKMKNQIRIERSNQKLRTELVLLATRKFRTPLAVIHTIVEKLNQDNATLSRSDTRQLLNCSRTLMQMVEELADFGQVSDGNDQESPDSADESESQNTPVPIEPINSDLSVIISSPYEQLNDVMRRQMSAYFQVNIVPGTQVCQRASETRPGAIVLDTDLKDSNAYEILRKLKSDAATKAIPVILISSFDNKRSLLKAIRSDADDYLPKPFNNDVLAALIIKKIGSSISSSMRHEKAAPSGPDETNADIMSMGQVALKAQTAMPPQQPLYKRAADKAFKERLDALIEANMDDNDFAVAAISSAMGMNRTSLCAKIKELNGITPVEYLRRARLRRAAELLGTTDMPVSEISYKVGITDATYFYRRFREFYGVSPREYRMRQVE